MQKKYNKSALDLHELLTLIRSKGFSITDQKSALHCLKTVSYHRLSPYLETLLRNHHNINNPLLFSDVWELYCFDRELRLLINDAIERIEVAFRTSMSETMSRLYSPHWYVNQELFNDAIRYAGFLDNVKNTSRDKHNLSIQEYYQHYDHPKYPPSWLVFEYLSFGACVSVFCNIKHLKTRRIICEIFAEHPTTLQSWLYAIRYMRNLCAHHARVWNRWFVVTPALSFMFNGDFTKPNTCYAHLIVLERLLGNISPNNIWKARLKSLISNHAKFPIHEMGYLANWENDSFWD